MTDQRVAQVRHLHAPIRYVQAQATRSGYRGREVWCASECVTRGGGDPLAWPCATARIVYTADEITAERAWRRGE
ncbi:hypothetical protein acdb102_45570 [Acidothermaceae bacterium B102]|nr:hypothetical protein acdb102_45570 [Acidothermaceae bacterium B102]